MRLPHRVRSAAGAWQGWSGAVLLVLLVLPPIRHATESSMTAHMLVQYSGLLLAGALLAAWPAGESNHRCNELGIAGLLAFALAMALLMVPRVLDLALVDARIEALKLLALVASGAALRRSWQRAGVVVQAFFLGNVLPMMAVVGTLYQDPSTRVCNAYRLDDQQTLGVALCWMAGSVAAVWLSQLGLRQAAPASSFVGHRPRSEVAVSRLHGWKSRPE